MAKTIDEDTVHIIVGPARSRALAHVIDVLEYDNFLCRCVRKQVDFISGKLLSVDPAGRRFAQIENFAWGSGVGCDAAIARRLRCSLTSSPNRFMVVDDVMGDASGTSASSAVNNDQIFHWIVGDKATDDELSKLVWATGVSWHFLGVIFSGATIADVPQRIASGECSELGNILEVVVGAYDGEGFIHWTPN